MLTGLAGGASARTAYSRSAWLPVPLLVDNRLPFNSITVLSERLVPLATSVNPVVIGLGIGVNVPILARSPLCKETSVGTGRPMVRMAASALVSPYPEVVLC